MVDRRRRIRIGADDYILVAMSEEGQNLSFYAGQAIAVEKRTCGRVELNSTSMFIRVPPGMVGRRTSLPLAPACVTSSSSDV